MQSNEAERRRWNDERWAALWPKRERMTDAITPSILEAASLGPGDRVLDVGSGGGRLALAAARVVGPGGRVVGADLSEPLAELARTRAQETGADNVEFHTLDVQTDQIPGGPFDVAVSQFGVMFFEDPVMAFANIRSQLEPGARLAFACWQRLEDNVWHFASAIQEYLPPAPSLPHGEVPPGPFAFADPARTIGILVSAGFGAVRRTAHELSVDVPHDAIFDDIQLDLMRVAPSDIEPARTAVLAYLQQFAVTPELLRLPLALQVYEARSE